ncbi:hypothetical protein AAHZ94_22645, partial [Streptomyces sp. HSW2009]
MTTDDVRTAGAGPGAARTPRTRAAEPTAQPAATAPVESDSGPDHDPEADGGTSASISTHTATAVDGGSGPRVAAGADVVAGGDAVSAVSVCAPRGGGGGVSQSSRGRAPLRQRLAPLVLLAADGAATVAALLLANALGALHTPNAADATDAANALNAADTTGALRTALPALVVLFALHARAGLYRPGLSAGALDELPVLVRHAVLTWCVVTTGLVALDPASTARWGQLLALLAAHAPLMCLARAVAHRVLRELRRTAPCPALVVGAGPLGERVLATLLATPAYGLRPVALVDPGPDGPPPPGAPPPRPPPGGGRREVRKTRAPAAGGGGG